MSWDRVPVRGADFLADLALLRARLAERGLRIPRRGPIGYEAALVLEDVMKTADPTGRDARRGSEAWRRALVARIRGEQVRGLREFLIENQGTHV